MLSWRRLGLCFALAGLLLVTACGEESSHAPFVNCTVGESGCACDVNERCLSDAICRDGLCVSSPDGDSAEQPDAETADGDEAAESDEARVEEEAEAESLEADEESLEREAESDLPSEGEAAENELATEADADAEPEVLAEAEEEVALCPCAASAATYCRDPRNEKPPGLIPDRIVTTLKDNASCKFSVVLYQGSDMIGSYEATGCGALFPNQVLAGLCTLSQAGEGLSLSCSSGSGSSLPYTLGACPAVHCYNLDTDYDESDRNCGGSCTPCGDAQRCNLPGDCRSKHCLEGKCVAAFCSDGIVNGTETCDDKNNNSGDGCDATCQQEVGWLCSGSPSVCAPPCQSKADCPAPLLPLGPCFELACLYHNCAQQALAYGTPTPEQTAGDCRRAICNGFGALTDETDDSDLPVDGKECTEDLCQAGLPSNPPQPSGWPCQQSGGAHCDGSGACVSTRR